MTDGPRLIVADANVYVDAVVHDATKVLGDPPSLAHIPSLPPRTVHPALHLLGGGPRRLGHRHRARARGLRLGHRPTDRPFECALTAFDLVVVRRSLFVLDLLRLGRVLLIVGEGRTLWRVPLFLVAEQCLDLPKRPRLEPAPHRISRNFLAPGNGVRPRPG